MNFLEHEDTQDSPKKTEDLPAEIQERLLQIRELKRRRLTNTTIAKLLNCGVATIYRDLKLIRQLFLNRATDLNIMEEIGASLDLFDEVIDKTMDGARASLEDNERVVETVDKNGMRTFAVKNIPDHAQSGRYFQTALDAMKKKMDLLIQIGMAQTFNKIAEKNMVNSTSKYNVASMNEENLQSALIDIQKKANEKRRHIHRLNGPDPLSYKDHKKFENDMAEHIRKLDEHLEMERSLGFE